MPPVLPTDHAVPDDLRWALDLIGPIANLRHEVAICAYLDPEWRLLGLRHMPSAQVDTVAAPMREIVRDALACDARYLLMAHNHPSGDVQPSRDDLAFTRRLARTLDAIGVTLIDHLIVSANATSSFRRLGLL